MKLFYLYALLVSLITPKNYAKDFEQNLDKLGVCFYEELACTAIGNNSNPVGYKCPERIAGVCVFGGKRYKHGEKIKNPTTCFVSCECFVKGNNSFIVCDYQDCEEINPTPGCQMVYDLENTCCQTKELCPPLDYTCEVEGNSYSEGDIFRPTDTCLVCVCKRGFKGKYEYPFCQRDVYGVELYHPVELVNNCAPVYLSPRGSILCSPARYLCKKDLIGINLVKSGKLDSGEKCNFAGNYFNRGDLIEVKYGDWPFSAKILCECLMPPQVGCFDSN